MDMWSVLGSALRRWYVVLVCVVIFVLPVLVIDTSSFEEYEVDGAVLLLEPRESEDMAPNPYSGSAGAEILAIEAQTAATRERFKEEGLSTDYELRDEAPVITFTAMARNPEQALATGEALVETLTATLSASQKQLDIPAANRVRTQVIDPPTSPQQTASDTTLLLGSAILGFIVGLVAAVVVDDRLSRRSGGDEQVADDTAVTEDQEPR